MIKIKIDSLEFPGNTTNSLRFRFQIVTRAAPNEQPMTAMRDTVTNTARRTSRKRCDSNPPASKRSRHPGLRRNDIPKIVKLLMDAVNDDDTDQDIDGVETPTTEETEVESITQELQNNISM